MQSNEVKFSTAEQGSEEWHSERLGHATASRMGDLMARTKSGYGAGRRNYLMELLCERLTGARQEGYTNAAMQRGIEMEPIARAAYELLTGSTVDQVGFVKHSEIDWLGASCDGIVGDDGLIEIKCMHTANHVDFIRTGNIDRKYYLQMQTQMICAKRHWCDFVSFDDRLPEPLQIQVQRVEYNHEIASEIIDEVLEFLGELDKIETEMRNRMEELAA